MSDFRSQTEVEIIVLKYDSLFTKRNKDLKSTPWFSFPNELLLHPDFFKINGNELKWFIWCVCICSKVMKKKVKIDLEQASHFLNMSKDDFFTMFEKLQGKQIDTATVSRPCADREPTASRPVHGPNITEHNITLHNTTLHNITSSSFAENSAQLVPAIIPEKSLVTKPSRKTFSVTSFQDFDQIFTEEQKRNYFELYPDIDFLKREFLKMHNWLIANPKKNKKGFTAWSQFVSNWLDKSWPQFQKTIPTNKADQSSVTSAEVKDRISKLFGEAV